MTETLSGQMLGERFGKEGLVMWQCRCTSRNLHLSDCKFCFNCRTGIEDAVDYTEQLAAPPVTLRAACWYGADLDADGQCHPLTGDPNGQTY